MAATLRGHPEVVEAWSVTGEADAIARVRAQDNADLERVIIALQAGGRSSARAPRSCLSRLVGRPAGPRLTW